MENKIFLKRFIKKLVMGWMDHSFPNLDYNLSFNQWKEKEIKVLNNYV